MEWESILCPALMVLAVVLFALRRSLLRFITCASVIIAAGTVLSGLEAWQGILVFLGSYAALFLLALAFLAIICALVEIITLVAIFAYGYVLRTFNLMARTDVDVAAVENDNISFEKKQEMEGYWNIAVFGLDASKRNSDVVMIVSINQDTGDIKLVSVFRDTYLNISSKDQYNKINQAYAQGGPEQGLAALNKNLDLNITSYVTFDWATIAEIINLLGGVDDIEISRAEFYYINAYITETVKETGIASFQLKSAGTQHLDGIQAVSYARLRLMDSDFARTERQKKIIKACFEKAKTVDYSVLNYIMLTCFPKVETNISLGDVVSMAQGILRYKRADTG